MALLVLIAIEVATVAGVLGLSVARWAGWRRLLARSSLVVWGLAVLNLLLLATVIRVY